MARKVPVHPSSELERGSLAQVSCSWTVSLPPSILVLELRGATLDYGAPASQLSTRQASRAGNPRAEAVVAAEPAAAAMVEAQAASS